MSLGTPSLLVGWLSCMIDVMQHDRHIQLKVVGTSGQISLGKMYAGRALKVETRADGSILLTPVTMVPEHQMWTVTEPHRSRIARGLAWATANPPGETDLASLSKRASSRRSSKARSRARR